jgi:hypothetical protein
MEWPLDFDKTVNFVKVAIAWVTPISVGVIIFLWIYLFKRRQITGISTPFLGLSWLPPKENSSKIAIFNGSINLTSIDNEAIISFLESNNRKIVFIDTDIDASVGSKEQFDIQQMGEINLLSSEINGKAFNIPNKSRGLITVTFYFCDGHVLNNSHGGTGLNIVDVNGFFEVSRTAHGGPTTAFHLKEISATLEEKASMLNR